MKLYYKLNKSKLILFVCIFLFILSFNFCYAEEDISLKTSSEPTTYSDACLLMEQSTRNNFI